MKIKALAFDFIGTIATVRADMDACIASLYEAASALIGLSAPLEAFKRVYREKAIKYRRARLESHREIHNRVWIREALEELGCIVGDEELDELVNSYFKPYMDSLQIPEETKSILRALKGYKLGLVSNFTHPELITSCLDKHGISGLFDCVVISGSIGWRKPHRRIFEHLLGLLGAAPEEVLYVGDDPIYDIDGAKAVGMKAVLIKGSALTEGSYYGIDPVKEPRFEPDYRIGSMKELMEILSRDAP
ncbi:MAG: HAD family hydrolase [Candidatus Bathyarchaeia archaeon]